MYNNPPPPRSSTDFSWFPVELSTINQQTTFFIIYLILVLCLLAARKKKPTGKTVAQDPEETQTFQDQSEILPTTETTPLRDALDPPRRLRPLLAANLRTQVEQNLSSDLGAPVSLTDEQFRVLLERLSAIPKSTAP